MKLAALVFASLVAACSSSSSPPDAGKDASADVVNEIDCSAVGCGMNPGCGQVCTEVCGCCGCAYGAVCGVCDASVD